LNLAALPKQTMQDIVNGIKYLNDVGGIRSSILSEGKYAGVDPDNGVLLYFLNTWKTQMFFKQGNNRIMCNEGTKE